MIQHNMDMFSQILASQAVFTQKKQNICQNLRFFGSRGLSTDQKDCGTLEGFAIAETREDWERVWLFSVCLKT